MAEISHFANPSEQAWRIFFCNGILVLLEPGQRSEEKEKASKDMKRGGEIIADGQTVYKNGRWIA